MDGQTRKTAGTSVAPEGAESLALRRLAAIVESSVDAIVTTDLEGVVTSWNAGATRMFAYAEHEMLGAPLAQITPPDRAREEQELLARVRDGAGVDALETSRWTKEHRVVHVTLTAAPLRGPDGNVVEVSKIFRDVTALKEKEREVARLSRLYAALSQVNEAIVKAASAQELLGKVCSILTEYNGFRLAWVGWHDPADQRLLPVAAAGDEISYVDAIRVYADERPEGRGPSGTAFRENRPYVCSDMLADPSTLPWRGEVLRRGFRGSAVFPIHKGGVTVATLNVYTGEVDFFREEEVALLTEAAGDISFALVEDQPWVRSVTRAILTRHGYQVLDAQGGEEALAAAAGHPGRIDLLVTDIVMPRMNGRVLAERLCVQRPGTPALFMSGNMEGYLSEREAQELASHYMQKPVTPETLLRRVRAVLDDKRE